MHRAIPLMVGVLLTACGEATPTVIVEGACVAAVNVDGVEFTDDDSPPVPPADVGEVHAVVTVYTGCQDQGRPTNEALEWAPGTSNFLPVGTQIHRVEGFSPTERLAYRADPIDEWLPLAPLRQVPLPQS
jgi:hypothetical protein